MVQADSDMDFDEKPKIGVRPTPKFEALQQESDEENPYMQAMNTPSQPQVTIKASISAKQEEIKAKLSSKIA